MLQQLKQAVFSGGYAVYGGKAGKADLSHKDARAIAKRSNVSRNEIEKLFRQELNLHSTLQRRASS